MSMKLYTLFVALLLFAASAPAQTSPFNVIFLSKPNAQTDRDYLLITNFSPGANITFTKTGTLNYRLDVTGTINGSNVAGFTTLSNSFTVLSNSFTVVSNTVNTNVWFLNGNTVGSTNTILGTLDNNPLKLFQFSQVGMEFRTNKSIRSDTPTRRLY